MRRFLIVAATAALMGCGSGNAQAPQRKPVAAPVKATTFAAFWSGFRAAALANDAGRLRAMSRATVLSHGELDDDPVRRLPAAAVPAAVAKLLAAPDAEDAGGLPFRATLAAGTGQQPLSLSGGQRRVGPFVFAPGSTGWQLAEIYRGD